MILSAPNRQWKADCRHWDSDW